MRICSDHRPSPKHPLNQWFPTLREIGCGTAADGGVENPYKFGLIGSSDTHVAAGSFDEDNYWSKVGLLDETPEQRGSIPGSGSLSTIGDPSLVSPASMRTQDGSGRTYRDTFYHHWGASGLAGVWAEQNTRAALFDLGRDPRGRRAAPGHAGDHSGAGLVFADLVQDFVENARLTLRAAPREPGTQPPPGAACLISGFIHARRSDD